MVASSTKMDTTKLFEMPLAKRQKALNPDNQHQAAMQSVYESSLPECDISPQNSDGAHSDQAGDTISYGGTTQRNLEPAVRTASGVE
jgi:hypothetical protein